MVRFIYLINLLIAISGFLLESKKSALIIPRLLKSFNIIYFSQFFLVSILAISLFYFGGKRFLQIVKGKEKLDLCSNETSNRILYLIGVFFLSANIIRVITVISSMVVTKNPFMIGLVNQSFAFLMPAGFIFIECARFNSLKYNYIPTKE